MPLRCADGGKKAVVNIVLRTSACIGGTTLERWRLTAGEEQHPPSPTAFLSRYELTSGTSV
jgi:hypothetical protein